MSVISERPLQFANLFPSYFARKLKSLKSVGLWKGSEFRSILLHMGPIVLFSVLPNDLYKHFLLLSVKIRLLLSSKSVNRYRVLSKHMLREFVTGVPGLYDKTVLTYNVFKWAYIQNHT